jgi:hypothetical protein
MCIIPRRGPEEPPNTQKNFHNNRHLAILTLYKFKNISNLNNYICSYSQQIRFNKIKLRIQKKL